MMNAYSSVGQTKWSWKPEPGLLGNITFKSNNDSTPYAQISADKFGKYFLIWSVTNGPCQPPQDTVALSFFQQPVPDAGPDIEECDTLQAQLSGITSVIGTWNWSSPTGGSISFLPDANRPDPIVVASTPGSVN